MIVRFSKQLLFNTHTKVVGFAYVFMLRLPGVLPIMVWFSIFATVGIVFAGAWYAGNQATQ